MLAVETPGSCTKKQCLLISAMQPEQKQKLDKERYIDKVFDFLEKEITCTMLRHDCQAAHSLCKLWHPQPAMPGETTRVTKHNVPKATKKLS